MLQNCRLLSLLLITIGILAKPATAAEVVLYSSNNVETVNRVVELFTKKNPDIKVSVVRAGISKRGRLASARPMVTNARIAVSGTSRFLSMIKTHLSIRRLR